jgi:hypothetical protein
MADLNLGEHFLNFPLHEDLQEHCGMDLRPYLAPPTTVTDRKQKAGARITMWLRWSRCMMGLKVSPYFTIKATHLAYEVVWGNPNDDCNALQWVRVELNLPGSGNYMPQAPWVQRL